MTGSKKTILVPVATAQSAPSTVRNIQSVVDAHGKAHVLAIGVSAYEKESRLNNLAACANDARIVYERFLDIKQLNADPDACRLCTEKSVKGPSRGEMLRLIKQLAEGADHSNRIILYYSGHGVRIGDEFYFVPNDAYATDDPELLVPFSRVEKLLGASDAKQKLVILDACFSGPDVTHMKAIPPDVSPKFLSEYLAGTKGTAVLSSSGIDETSTVQSPNPKVSLFTHYLAEALSGSAQALESGRLSLDSLYSYLSVAVQRRSKSYGGGIQKPALRTSANGTMILGDFTMPLLTPNGIDLEEHPIHQIAFSEPERGEAKKVLTNMQRSFSMQYIEKRVNDTIPSAFRETFGEYAAKLSHITELPDVTADGNGVEFPDGGYSVTYEASDSKRGVYRHEVWFGPTWFEVPDRMIQVLACLDMTPDEIFLSLKQKQAIDSAEAGLRSRGWTITSKLQEKVKARHGSYTLELTEYGVRFGGFAAHEIFGSASIPESSALVLNVLSMLPSKERT